MLGLLSQSCPAAEVHGTLQGCSTSGQQSSEGKGKVSVSLLCRHCSFQDCISQECAFGRTVLHTQLQQATGSFPESNVARGIRGNTNSSAWNLKRQMIFCDFY